MRDDDRAAGRVVLRALGDALDQLEVARLAVLGLASECREHHDQDGLDAAQEAAAKLTGATLNASGAAQLVEAAMVTEFLKEGTRWP